MIDREQNGTRPDSRAGRGPAPTARTGRFVGVGGGFQLEYAGPVIRIWHDPCLNHDLLPNDENTTVVDRKAAHRCGERISPWDRGEHGALSSTARRGLPLDLDDHTPDLTGATRDATEGP